MESATVTKLPFQLGHTFCGVEPLDQQPIALVGAPFDGATTFRSGARMAPNTVRQASLMLCDGTHHHFDVDLRKVMGDAGNMGLPTGHTHQALHLVTQQHQQLASAHHVITIGGDHSITLGVLRSLHQLHGCAIRLVHFDAHCDTWEDHFGESTGHGTWLRQAIQQGLVDARHTISVGIRSPCDAVTRSWLSDQGGHTITAESAASQSPALFSGVIAQVIGQHMPTYLSLDIDCLDPAHAPGTGTPEIGGLSSMWLKSTLDHLFVKTCDQVGWVGMDLVEVAPAYDHSNITSLAAATFVWQYASMIGHGLANPL
jgi:agmatinase